MFSWIKRLFVRAESRTPEPFESPRQAGDPTFPDDIEDDPVMRECIMRAYRTGKPVFGSRDADGQVTITEVKD